jgi:ribosomal protein S4
MLKKTLLKNTHEFLEKNFSENFFLLKKSNKKRKKLLLIKGSVLKRKLLKFKQKNFRLFYQINANLLEKSSEKSLKLNKVVLLEKYNNFLVSMNMIKSEFEKRQTRSSDFKNKLKEKKKLSILYGNLSNKKIKKTLQQACKLHGNTADNLLILLESRLDVILYRALFFSSIKSARQWIGCNKILVNSKCINIASYKVNFGDIISIKPKDRKSVASRILKFFLQYNLHNRNNTVKSLTSKANKLLLNTEKKFIFNFPRDKLASKKKLKLKTSQSKLHKTKLSLINGFWKDIILTNKNLVLSKFKSCENEIFVTSQASLQLTLLFKFNLKNKNKCFLIREKNINIKNTSAFLKNEFKKKHRYIISNFYFRLLHNQIKPINKFLLKQNINKLTKIFKINNFILYTEKYKTFNNNNLNIIKNSSIKVTSKFNYLCHKSVNSLKWHFLFYKEKLNTKAEILLSNINKNIVKQTKQIVNSLLNNRYIYEVRNKYHMNHLLKLNYIKCYDILFFLKLKNIFFKKREFSIPENLSRKINFKPLNLEISYKTLTVIYLYRSQKIIFPCSLDIELLLKGNL